MQFAARVRPAVMDYMSKPRMNEELRFVDFLIMVRQ
jgi:hypothetical protein